MYRSKSRSTRRSDSRACSVPRKAIDTSMAFWTPSRAPNEGAKWRRMDEFQLIDRLIEILGDTAHGAGVLLGPGDDAALIAIPEGSVAVASIDTLVAGVHFPAKAPADLVGARALGVTVSDLAAMGADP